MTFEELHCHLCDALLANRKPVLAEILGPDGKHKLIRAEKNGEGEPREAMDGNKPRLRLVRPVLPRLALDIRLHQGYQRMFTTTRRNKDIATAVLNGATYLDVGILYNISWERAFQITRKLCLHVEATEKHNIRKFRQRAKKIILKIEAIPEA